jgi:hypothetical protein
MDILHLMQWDEICHVLLNYRTCFQYTCNMDVTNIVYQDSTYLYMYSNLTSYWTIVMTNNGHYLYMLKKMKHLHIGQKTNSNTCYQMENTADYNYLERI